jgi:hypothetical protein
MTDKYEVSRAVKERRCRGCSVAEHMKVDQIDDNMINCNIGTKFLKQIKNQIMRKERQGDTHLVFGSPHYSISNIE